MSRLDRSELLKGWALEEGFDRVGISSVEPSQHGEAFRRWLESGGHAGMAYMERRVDARLKPETLLQGVRSVLCVALQYHPLREEQPPGGDFWPHVARYARGVDYHHIIRRRLEKLASRVGSTFPGSKSLIYVDTGPVLERELAARAGLGAVGKHTNLLHPEAGSWFLLGELFLTLELTPDVPLADLCGSCSSCLEACPTGALPEPFRLDSARCISYWTIEHRGDIPRPFRLSIGRWAFGCDLCQEACPWNQEPQQADHSELRLAGARAAVDLTSLLNMNRSEYLMLFRGTPLKRARVDGLRRNAAVSMGNSGNRHYVPALAAAAADSEPVVRSHVAWALGQLGGADARSILEARLEKESDQAVREELIDALETATME